METKEEQIGFHKGSLTVLSKEQETFMQMLSMVQQFMKAHIKALKDLGVDMEAEAKKSQEAMQKQEQDEKSIDERLG